MTCSRLRKKCDGLSLIFLAHDVSTRFRAFLCLGTNNFICCLCSRIFQYFEFFLSRFYIPHGHGIIWCWMMKKIRRIPIDIVNTWYRNQLLLTASYAYFFFGVKHHMLIHSPCFLCFNISLVFYAPFGLVTCSADDVRKYLLLLMGRNHLMILFHQDLWGLVYAFISCFDLVQTFLNMRA